MGRHCRSRSALSACAIGNKTEFLLHNVPFTRAPARNLNLRQISASTHLVNDVTLIRGILSFSLTVSTHTHTHTHSGCGAPRTPSVLTSHRLLHTHPTCAHHPTSAHPTQQFSRYPPLLQFNRGNGKTGAFSSQLLASLLGSLAPQISGCCWYV